MSENWDAVAAEVTEALGDVGYKATLLRRGARVGPEHSPRFLEETETEINVIETDFTQMDRQTTVIEEYDKKILAPGQVQIGTSDRIRLIDGDYSVVSAGSVQPGGTSVLREVHLRP